MIRSSASRAAASRARASRSGSPAPKTALPGDQQLRSCLDDGGDRVVSHAAINFNLEVQAQIAAELDEMADLVRGKTG